MDFYNRLWYPIWIFHKSFLETSYVILVQDQEKEYDIKSITRHEDNAISVLVDGWGNSLFCL